MKILFTKITESRKPEFEIITSIVEHDNHQLYVYKQGVHDSQHIFNMERNASLLRDYLPEYVDECYVEDDIFKGKFYFGKPLSELFVEGKDDLAVSIFKKIIDCIPTKKFKDFKNDEQRFYNVSFSNEEESFVVSDYDLTFFNIIFDGKVTKVIDYEWVFTYPIPKKAIIYRAFKQIKEQFPTCNLDLGKYLKEFDITDI